MSVTTERPHPDPDQPGTPWGSPDSMNPDEWRDWLEESAASFERVGHDRVSADSAAYGQALNAMYARHVEPMPGMCVGCGEPIGDRPRDTYTIGGETVHADSLDCRIEHGRKWRTHAADRLKALGIEPPAEYEL